MGFEPIISILKLRGITYKFTQQKTVNLLSALETINMLIMGRADTEPGKDSNKLANRTVLVQKKLLDYLLMLGVESQWAPVAVRCMVSKSSLFEIFFLSPFPFFVSIHISLYIEISFLICATVNKLE
jgi:hypothetical protein